MIACYSSNLLSNKRSKDTVLHSWRKRARKRCTVVVVVFAMESSDPLAVCLAENSRLRSECRKYRRIACLLSQMNALTQSALLRCQCLSSRDNVINKWIVFRQQLQDVKSGDDVESDDSTADSDAETLIDSVIDALIDCRQLLTKEDDQNENRETRRGRGRPPKKLKTKGMRRATKRPLTRRPCSERKGKIVTEEGKEVFMSRTKRLQCQWPGCDAMFRDREDLENHKWRHTGTKLYQCDWPGCLKSFSSRCYLKKHHMTHIDPNVFKCLHDGCEEAFVSSPELNAHFAAKHCGQKPFQCVSPPPLALPLSSHSSRFRVSRIVANSSQWEQNSSKSALIRASFADRSSGGEALPLRLRAIHDTQLAFALIGREGENPTLRRKFANCSLATDIHVCEVHQTGNQSLLSRCDSTFSSHNKLRIHKMKHTGEKPFKSVPLFAHSLLTPCPRQVFAMRVAFPTEEPLEDASAEALGREAVCVSGLRPKVCSGCHCPTFTSAKSTKRVTNHCSAVVSLSNPSLPSAAEGKLNCDWPGRLRLDVQFSQQTADSQNETHGRKALQVCATLCSLFAHSLLTLCSLRVPMSTSVTLTAKAVFLVNFCVDDFVSPLFGKHTGLTLASRQGQQYRLSLTSL
ncbi:unnamed protein product [Oppiella nova]|uniref:C2H2-type domain-containing protein n=1 Tax=Oppiella nova TaxID=334625 RepID=A0A7R9LD05_9ACAR|nr:unnamed protein product [Oppiella nova]CAG2161753.1 unnamed protein product [Oppiella nova]